MPFVLQMTNRYGDWSSNIQSTPDGSSGNSTSKAQYACFTCLFVFLKLLRVHLTNMNLSKDTAYSMQQLGVNWPRRMEQNNMVWEHFNSALHHILRGFTYLDDCNATSKLGNSLRKLLCVIHRVCLCEFFLDLLYAQVNLLLICCVGDERAFCLLDRHLQIDSGSSQFSSQFSWL